MKICLVRELFSGQTGKEEPMGNLYGYIRVSTREQNEDRQILALKELSIPEKNLFMDKQSGKDFKRPQYRKMVLKLKKY